MFEMIQLQPCYSPWQFLSHLTVQNWSLRLKSSWNRVVSLFLHFQYFFLLVTPRRTLPSWQQQRRVKLTGTLQACQCLSRSENHSKRSLVYEMINVISTSDLYENRGI